MYTYFFVGWWWFSVVRGISFSLSHLHVCHGHSWFRRRNYSKEFGKDVVSALPDLGLLRRHPSVNSYSTLANYYAAYKAMSGEVSVCILIQRFIWLIFWMNKMINRTLPYTTPSLNATLAWLPMTLSVVGFVNYYWFSCYVLPHPYCFILRYLIPFYFIDVKNFFTFFIIFFKKRVSWRFSFLRFFLFSRGQHF